MISELLTIDIEPAEYVVPNLELVLLSDVIERGENRVGSVESLLLRIANVEVGDSLGFGNRGSCMLGQPLGLIGCPSVTTSFPLRTPLR